ncbi:hypothetical protein Tco_0642881 [Tanacetum coccineum]
MGRDTVQLETAVSTITQEYLLEFTSEYGISEDLHQELPNRGDRIVYFPEGKIHLSQLDGFVQSDQRSESCRDQDRHPSSYCSRGATANEQINEGDGVEDQGPKIMASVVPPVGPSSTMGAAPNLVEEEETAADAPLMSKRRYKRANEESNANALRKVLRKDFDASHPTQSTVGGKSLASIRLGASSTISAPSSQETPAGRSYQVSYPLHGCPRPDPTSPTMVMSPGSIYEPEWGVTNGYRLDTPSSCQELVDHLAPPVYFSELRHLPNEDFLGQFNMTLAWKVAMGSQLQLRFEQEAKLLRISVAQVACQDQRIQAMEGEKKNMETLLEAEADMRKAAEAKNASWRREIKATFEDIKKYEDERSGGWGERTLRDQTFANVGCPAGIIKGFDEMEKFEGRTHGMLMASLYLESDTGKDAPQWIRDFHPSSSQLKIPVYLEKKKKCRIVCRTHGVGSAHHARSDGIPVSVPTVVPQGLAILLADVATQTDVLEEESSPKLTRSKSLPSYSCDT